MKRILVLQHVEHEDLGTMERIARKKGYCIDYVKLFRRAKMPLAADDYSGIIAMGGPMGVYEEQEYPFLAGEVEFIRRVIMSNLPLLGICLGAQIIARAAGANVYRGKRKEIGWYPLRLTDEGKRDSIFIGLPEEFMVFQWHGDTFDIPCNGKNLASSDNFPHQAIRIGKNTYGLQFHLEVTEEMIKEWVAVNEKEFRSVDYIDVRDIAEKTPEYIKTMRELGEVVFSRFFRLL